METSPTSHPDLVYARPPAAPGAGGAFPASLTCPVCGELASVPLSRRRTGVPGRGRSDVFWPHSCLSRFLRFGERS